MVGSLVYRVEVAWPPDRHTPVYLKAVAMKLVKQVSPTTCGQACLAMIHGISLDESIRHVGHTGEVSDIDMLMLSGSGASFVDGPPSPDIVAIQKHRDPNGEHWTVSFRGQLLDPAEIGEKLWPVYKHFAVDWMC